MKTALAVFAVVAMLAASGGCAPARRGIAAGLPENLARMHATAAGQLGWTEEYQRGNEIIALPRRFHHNERTAADIEAFRGETVAIVGVSHHGVQNDLWSQGIYMRIVNPEGKDLRPQSVYWSVFVRGKVLEILTENRLIILEVTEKNWQVLWTG